MSKHPNDSSAMAKLLRDYNINGMRVPHWFDISAVLVINGEISQTDFSIMVNTCSINKTCSPDYKFKVFIKNKKQTQIADNLQNA